MIKAVCLNDKDKPKEIPSEKWIKEGKTYHVIYTVWSIPSQTLGVHLYEISLDECCSPYEYFDVRRFGFTHDDLLLLQKLIKDCNDTDFSIEELMEKTCLT